MSAEKTVHKGHQIRQWLTRADRNITWLANKVGISIQLLRYKLDNPTAISADLYDEIKDLFRKQGVIIDERERCSSLVEATLKIDSAINGLLAVLNQNVIDYAMDKKLDFREKRDLSIHIESMKKTFNEQIEQLEQIIEG